MNLFESNNIEILTFHYLLQNIDLIPKTDKKTFVNKDIQILYKLVQRFVNDYGAVPKSNSLHQLRELASQDKEVQTSNPAKQPEECIDEFMSSTETILAHPVHQYTPQYFKDNALAYLIWQKAYNGTQKTVNYMSDAKPTTQNIRSLVSNMQSMYLNETTYVHQQEDAVNFWSPKAHVQVQTEDLIPTAWPTFNKFLNGGFEKKTLTHFWAPPNAGKSLFLGTIGRDISLLGKNVYIATLEMGTQKYAKRMGSSIFNIPLSEYSKHNEAFWTQKIAPFFEGDEFNRVPGACYIQRFTHASPLSITLAADRKAKELNLKWDVVIYDYLGEMESSHGFTLENMYALHKINNGELFDHAVNYDWAGITAQQVTPENYGTGDMTLKAAAEGRGITHRTDNIFGIITTPAMHAAGKFFLKNLKARDNEYKDYFMRLNIDYKTFHLTDDRHEIAPGNDLVI